MSTYEALLNALNTPADSPELQALLAQLKSPSALKKVGGYRARVAAKASGVSLSFGWSKPAWVLNNAFLYPGGRDGFSQFQDKIERQVSMSATRTQVRSVLGTPSWAGGGAPVVENTLVDYHWDRFDFETYSVRFDYEEEQGEIRLVSVMTRELMLELNANRV
jgi:hypothetical protein